MTGEILHPLLVSIAFCFFMSSQMCIRDSDSGDAENDPLYDQAVEIVLKNKRASISLVQRHLRIGYNRSARLIEAMEKAGLVSTMDARGGREVLARREAE